MTEDLEQPASERDAALLRLKKKRDLRGHAFAFVVINAAVWGIWAATGAGDLWPMWLTGIWAIGLVFNAWDVYFRKPITEEDVRREVGRLRPQQ
ncbi:MAG: 2TM domain-containing protein [Solirubrobacteraceae bacterium]